MADYGAIGAGKLNGGAKRSYRALAATGTGIQSGGAHYGPTMIGGRGACFVGAAGRFQGGPFLQGWDGMDETQSRTVAKPRTRDITVG